MAKNTTLTITQDGRDVALMFALANSIVNQHLLQAIYAKVFDFSLQESEQQLEEMRRKTFAEMSIVLAEYGNLDVPALNKLLGL